MAEDLTAYLQNAGIKVRYMHHDIDTIERMEIIRDLRLGTFDVLVGINLLRRAWTCPRSPWWPSWTRTRRASSGRDFPHPDHRPGRPERRRHGGDVRGHHHPSMRRAIDETERRREKQDAFNKAHGIVPRTVIKSVRELLEISATSEDVASNQRQGRVRAMTWQEKAGEIARLEKAKEKAAKMLEFELAATLRDQIIELRGSEKNSMELLPKRKPNRLTGYDYSQPGVLFHHHLHSWAAANFAWGAQCAPASEIPPLTEIGEITERAIQSIPNHYPYVFVEKYVVMPNHIHLMLRIEGTGRTVRPLPRRSGSPDHQSNERDGHQMCQVSRLAKRAITTTSSAARRTISAFELHRHESCQVAGGLLLLPE